MICKKLYRRHWPCKFATLLAYFDMILIYATEESFTARNVHNFGLKQDVFVVKQDQLLEDVVWIFTPQQEVSTE